MSYDAVFLRKQMERILALKEQELVRLRAELQETTGLLNLALDMLRTPLKKFH